MSLQFTSLEQLNKESLNYQYNEQLSLAFYFKLCDQLLNKTVAIFDYQKWKVKLQNNENLSTDLITDNGMEWCFILQMRYLDLMNNRLVYHSEFVFGGKHGNEKNLRQEFVNRMQNEVAVVIENVAWLKEKLKSRYEDLKNYKEKKLLADKEYMELKTLKEHIKDENTLRKNALLRQQGNNLTEDFPINIDLSRSKQFEKDRFLQNIKRKNSHQQLQYLEIQSKKIKYGMDDLVSSLSSSENGALRPAGVDLKRNPGYVLPVLTPHNSSENLVAANSANNTVIRYNLPDL